MKYVSIEIGQIHQIGKEDDCDFWSHSCLQSWRCSGADADEVRQEYLPTIFGTRSDEQKLDGRISAS